MQQRFRYKIGSLPLRIKLTIMFLVISIIPSLLVGMLSHATAQKNILEHHLSEMRLRLNIIDDALHTYIIDGVDYTSAKIATHEGIRRLLGEKGLHYTYEQKETDKQELRFIVLDNRYKKGTDSIYIFGTNGEQYTNDWTGRMYTLPLSEEQLKVLDDTSLNVVVGGLVQQGDMIFYPYVRKICYPVDDVVGYAAININMDGMDELCTGEAEESQADVYMVDDTGRIVSSSVPRVRGSNFEPSDTNDTSMRLDGEAYVFEAVRNELLSLTVYALKKQSLIDAEAMQIAWITIEAVALSFVICVLLAIVFSATITRPLQKLMGNMQSIEQGKEVKLFSPSYDDEIGKLGKQFGAMTVQLDRSIEEIYKIEEAKREAEFKVLEAQINPHFLYNTLSTIISLIEYDRKEEAVEVTEKLAQIFRETMGRGTNTLITIQQEFAHVVNYMSIQQIRYRDQFACIYEVDENITHFYIIRMILQPLAENAIYHGVKNLEGGGIIKMIGFREGARIVIEIWDNGGCTDEPRIKELNDWLWGGEEPREGIGIMNVHRRVQHHYGHEYGLRFRLEGNFTVAQLVFPVDEGA